MCSKVVLIGNQPSVEGVHNVDLPSHVGVRVALVVDDVGPGHVGGHLKHGGVALLALQTEGVPA